MGGTSPVSMNRSPQGTLATVHGYCAREREEARLRKMLWATTLGEPLSEDTAAIPAHFQCSNAPLECSAWAP